MPIARPLSVNPLLSTAAVASTLREHWGIEGALRDLGSLQDQNVRVRTADGSTHVLKIVAAGTPGDRELVELQNAGMRHVAARPRDFAAPVAVDARDGRDIVEVDGLLCRLLTWVDGHPLADRPWLGVADLAALGAFAARVAGSLTGFAHPGLDRSIVWDARGTLDVVSGVLPQLPAPAAEAVTTALAPLRALGDLDLPVAVVHGDVTPSNVQCRTLTGPDPQLSGVVDFGDLMRSWRIADVAAAVAGAAEHPSVDDVLAAARATLAGYHSVTPVTADEAAALWPLVLARAALVTAVSHVQAGLSDGNWYARDAVDSGQRALAAVLAVPPALAATALGLVVGALPARRPPSQAPAELVPGLASASVLDLSVGSELMDDGVWQAPDALAGLLPRDGVAIGRWGEFRLLDGAEPAAAPPATLQLGADVFTAAGTPVAAPVDVVVAAVGTDRLRLELDVDPPHLLLVGLTPAAGLAPGDVVPAGGHLGAVAPGTPATPAPAAARRPDGDRHPGHRRARRRLVVAVPGPVLVARPGCRRPPVPTPAALRTRRDGVVAASQHLYYRTAPQMVRGWRHLLCDAQGRSYLDMINNIAAVGHSHPRVAAAAARQFRLLNTNSRFLYDAMTRYCERMAALLPAGLDRVYLVNSGSEAADLALQLARAWTGRRDVLAIAGAYHGWTGAVLDISTSVNDRPYWRDELGSDVRVVDQPNPYRAAGLEACLDSVERAAATGGIAAFVAEPLLGNQGAVEPYPGYLAGAFDIVRRHGGLCIADEVQVGMARTGDFWAFEHEAAEHPSAVPDILYTAKATGNGHPLGVVVCSSEVARVFDERTAFFASTGGGPVSCEIGLAVLDVIRDEGLQQRARTVGAHLRAGLEALAERYELIGAVHGRGLYAGVELVDDRVTKHPSRWAAEALSERLLDLGVVMQPTGDDLSVLKVKPPLTLDEAGADFFVAALDRALGELGAR